MKLRFDTSSLQNGGNNDRKVSVSVKPKLKGVDALVATIMLIVIAVVIASAVANWQNWFLPQYAENIGNTARTQLECARAGISLDDITYNCRNLCLQNVDHTLTASIRNTGDVSLPIYSIYLQNTAGGMFEFSVNKTLGLDQTYDFTNSSKIDCSGINHTIARVIIATGCADMPTVFNGDMITWLNC